MTPCVNFLFVAKNLQLMGTFPVFRNRDVCSQLLVRILNPPLIFSYRILIRIQAIGTPCGASSTRSRKNLSGSGSLTSQRVRMRTQANNWRRFFPVNAFSLCERLKKKEIKRRKKNFFTRSYRKSFIDCPFFLEKKETKTS